MIYKLDYQGLHTMSFNDPRMTYPNWCREETVTGKRLNSWWTNFHSLLVGVIQHEDHTNLIVWTNTNAEATFRSGGWELAVDIDTDHKLNTTSVLKSLPKYVAQYFVL